MDRLLPFAVALFGPLTASADPRKAAVTPVAGELRKRVDTDEMPPLTADEKAAPKARSEGGPESGRLPAPRTGWRLGWAG